ncbi:unnamed protein product, partial [Porites lobata]
FEKLSKHQEEAIRQVVELKVDVYVNLPTGYGKSVVFQALPTVFASLDKCEKNIVIVISPLINLMKDQVSRLSSLGVSAISLSDISSAAEIKKVESGEFSIVYGSPESWLGDIRWRRINQRVVLEMLHSCSPKSNKDLILESFQCDEGHIRILVATIAFGMGVDCKKVYRTIHFGPAKNVESYLQESGRAGRDGSQCTAYLLYQGMQLIHVDQDTKSYIKSNGCRRKQL